MKSATFTNNGMKIKATALNSAGMGFLSSLQNSGQYTEEEAIELCFEKDGDLVSVEELQIKERETATEKEKVQKVILAAREKLSVKQLRETLEGMGYLVFLSFSRRAKKTTMSVNIPEVCHVGTWTV